MKYLLAIALTACLVLGALVSTSIALPIYGGYPLTDSTEGLGSFTGDFTYTAHDDLSATISVSLTNTTASYGGFITGFGFNNPNDLIEEVSGFTTTNSNFSPVWDPDAISASPFGYFDIASILEPGTELTGAGGDPTRGIGIGDTATFTFDIIGTSLLSLDENSFFNTLSAPPNDNEGEENLQAFVVRFKGLDEPPTAGSDKVVGELGVVPEPSTVFLLGIGLLGVLGLGRKIKK